MGERLRLARPRCRSATSRSTRPIRTSSGSAPARRTIARARPWGDGVYKSTDGGKTWKNMGLRDSQHIGRIVIHPTDPDIVYVGGRRPAVGPEQGARRLQDHRRRQDVAARPRHRREHRRHRPGHGSRESEDADRGRVLAAPHRVWLQRRRARRRHLQEHRCRPDLAQDRRRPAGGRHGPHRPRLLSPQLEHRLCDRREP